MRELAYRLWSAKFEAEWRAGRRPGSQAGGERSRGGRSTFAFPTAPSLAEDRATLGLGAGASVADVKKAYRRSALEHHPDRGGDAAKFIEVTDAYRRLTAAFEGQAAE